MDDIIFEISPDGTFFAVRYVGNITYSILQERQTAIMQHADRISSGFTLLTDLSRLDTMEYSCTKIIARLMDHFSARGVARVVRVIPDVDKDIGLNILSMFHYDPSIPITTCASLAEAETLLAR